jgi:hypothetical protein
MDAAQRASSEAFTNALRTDYIANWGLSKVGLADNKPAREFATPRAIERWDGFEAEMNARLDSGDKLGAAMAIRQIYSDIAHNGAELGEHTAAAFMREWLDNQPAGPDGKLRTISLTEGDMKSVLDTTNTQQKLAQSFIKSPAWTGKSKLSVNNLSLPKITIGEANRNMYHALGEFTVRFTGDISVTTTKKDASKTYAVTFDGTFGFDDIYDWSKSKGKSIPLGDKSIPDTWAELVEQQGLAKGFIVDGKIKTKVTGTVEIAD